MKLHKDSRYINQPEGTIRNAINIVKNSKTNAITNEQGFDQYSSLVTGKTCIGFCRVEDTVIVFLTNKDRTGNDEIGRLVDGVYTTILNDTNNSGLLNFDLLNAIQAKGYKNGNGEITVVFAQKDNPLRILNVDDLPFNLTSNWFTNAGDINLLRVFPLMNAPIINDSEIIIEGGSLNTGAYNIVFQYRNKNGQTSNFTEPSKTFYISNYNTSTKFVDIKGAESNIKTNKSINISLTDLDVNYDFLDIIVIQTSDGVVTAKKLDFITLENSTADYTIVNFEDGSNVSLQEILTPKVEYNAVEIIELLNDTFYIADLKKTNNIKYQKYANNIVVNYFTEVKAITPESLNNFSDSLDAGFAHNEVYALNIHFKLKNGLLTEGFHIPGRDPQADTSPITDLGRGDLSNSQFNSQFATTVKKYQVENTSNHPNAPTNMGYWENQNEIYPDSIEYDGSTDYNGDSIVSGRDLRGTNVKHHKFPTLEASIDIDHSGSSSLGISLYPKLNINVTNVVIPNEIVDEVQGFYISYIKRDYNNSIVLGQSIFQFEGEGQIQGGAGFTNQGDTVANIGNFTVDDVDSNGKRIIPKKLINNDGLVRFHAFNLLVNKPSINPTFITNSYKIRLEIGNAEPTGITDRTGQLAGYGFDKRRYVMNFSEGTRFDVSNTEYLKRVLSYQYVPENIASGNYDNRHGEEYLQLKIENCSDLISTDSTDNEKIYINDVIAQRTNSSTLIEDVYLTNLNQLLTDVYKGFYQSRKLVLLNGYKKITTAGTYSLNSIDGADTFIGYYGIMRTCPVGYEELRTEVGQNCITVKGFLCENVLHINLRHLDETNPQSFYYPEKSNITGDIALDWFDIFNTGDERFLLYNSDYSTKNENIISIPFNPFNDTVIKFPNRIHKSIVTGRETQKLVLSFLTADYVEMPKDRGRIVGLNVLDNKLLIRLKDSTYLTVPNQRIKLSETTAFLGNGEIFENEPQEIITADNGIIGSNSKFSVITTKYGAIIPDPKAGRIFLLASQAEEISEYGLRDMMIKGLDYELKYWLEFDYTTVLYNTDKLRLLLDESVYSMYSISDFTVGEFIWLENFTTFAEILAVRSNAGNIEIDTAHDYDNRTIDKRMFYEKTSTDDTFDNPYIGYGIIVGYDHEHDRILITKKGEPVFFNPDKYKGLFLNNVTFLNTLSDGDIVKWGKTYKKYNG